MPTEPAKPPIVVDNWKTVLLHSLAVLFAYLGIVVSYADTAYAWLQSAQGQAETAFIDPTFKTWLLRICFVLVILGRLKKQESISGPAAPKETP